MNPSVENLGKAGSRLSRALRNKCATDKEYYLALTEFNDASNELHLDAVRRAEELLLSKVAISEVDEATTETIKLDKWIKLRGKKVVVTFNGGSTRRAILKLIDYRNMPKEFEVEFCSLETDINFRHKSTSIKSIELA